MIKKGFTAISLLAVFLFGNTTHVLANHVAENGDCEFIAPNPTSLHCKAGLVCKTGPGGPSSSFGKCVNQAVQDAFGSITPPLPLQQFIGKDPTGAGGISRFLSNLVALFYGLAGIVLIFMLLWGAWDWMTSEGDKEKLDSARKKIINAIVGIILFAIAFALIQILGQFTGFKFFQGQK